MLIGDFSFPLQPFQNLDDTFKRFYKNSFHELPSKDKFTLINKTLLELIQQSPTNSFLLGAVLDFVDRVNREKLLNDNYRLYLFEFWLNNYSGLSPDERYLVRSKIVGKYIPREAYQTYFPIGLQKRYPGSHFVVAHLSPDIDTTIASFWGFIDAFGAEVAQAQHIWNLPGGAPDSHITLFFRDLFGPSIFSIARATPTLSLSAIDMVTQKGIVKAKGEFSSQSIDHGNDRAVIYVDENGHYIGDFRATDVEPIKQITNVFKSCLYWFENIFHVELISLFARLETTKDLEPFLSTTFLKRLDEVSHLQEFPESQIHSLKKFLSELFHLPKGLESTFGELMVALDKRGVKEALDFKREVEGLKNSDLFDKAGVLKEERSKIFHRIESIIKVLDAFIVATRNLVERLDFLMEIKKLVLGLSPQYVLLRSDLEELKNKMKNFDYLTVVIPENEGKFHPVGVVRAVDLRKEVLGTVSFRDFSNFQETKMASYLQVISVIDHHKIDLKTVYAPKIEISDAQSSNVLLAEKAFEINDRYGLGGLTLNTIQEQLKELSHKEISQEVFRLKSRLLNRELVAQFDTQYSINPVREFYEYLSFLHAILDDTDLLSKVTDRDVLVVVSLLNRLKSISIQKEVEVLNLNGLPRDEKFAKKAAELILKNQEMYSIYKKIYEFKEQEVEANILLCVQELVSNTFADTKEQNGCCRVGQTKIFSSNFPTYLEHRNEIRKQWLKTAEETYKSSPEIDFHLHMVSTVPSADEVHGDAKRPHPHQDEIWLWIPETQIAQIHLTRFLSAFQGAVEVLNNKMEVEFLGTNPATLESIFERNFLDLPKKETKADSLPIAVLHFNPGSINSRKSMITPYLPRLVS